MVKNVLIVTGSPRANGNSCLLAEAFAKGAESAGNKVVVYDADKKAIKGCRACNKCWSKGKACINNEEFNNFIELLYNADAIAFASPVYWESFPAPLKALIDKMYSLVVPMCTKDFSEKKTIMLACGDGPEESAFDVVNKTHRGLAAYLKWDVIEPVQVGHLVEAGAVKATDGIERAEKAGKTIFQQMNRL